ncbi:MAG: DUF2802 domain-containing protein [Rhodanobacter sp.]
MWLEPALVGFAVVQSVLLVWLCWRSWQLRKRIDLLALAATTDVPTSMLVITLSKIEHRLKVIEGHMHASTPVPFEAPPAPELNNYDLARQLAQQGATAELLVERCGLSRDEAELLHHLHPLRPEPAL